MTIGIYKIEALCPVARMARMAIYIGQSVNIEIRWKEHYKRFPKDQYSYEILLACDEQYLDFFEKAFIDGYDSHRCGLNKTIGGRNVRIQYLSEETRRKMSEAKKGKRNPHSSQWNRRISESLRERYGTILSIGPKRSVKYAPYTPKEERQPALKHDTAKKLSAQRKGRTRSTEELAKVQETREKNKSYGPFQGPVLIPSMNGYMVACWFDLHEEMVLPVIADRPIDALRLLYMGKPGKKNAKTTTAIRIR